MESLIKNHPFIDGNKRTAITSAGILLQMNGFIIVPRQLSSVIPACPESKRDMIPDVAGMTILRHNKVDMTIKTSQKDLERFTLGMAHGKIPVARRSSMV